MDVTRAIRRIHLHTAHGDEDCTQLAEEIADLLRALPAIDRRAVIRHAYWRMPDVPTAALRMAVGGEPALRALAGRGPVIGGCRRCGQVLRARHRDLLDDEMPATCSECQAAVVGSGSTSAAPDRSPTPEDGVRILSTPHPRRPARFGWEFQAAPRPWQPRAPALTDADRRWAEHYPDVGA